MGESSGENGRKWTCTVPQGGLLERRTEIRQQPDGVVGSTIVFKVEEIIACWCSDQNYLVKESLMEQKKEGEG